MGKALREVIKDITRDHLKLGNQLFGQCLTAVGWVNGTVPELSEDDGIVELSMADVMAGGIVVGAALTGKRPIYLVRYQGFQWFNAPIIANYAGKSKDLWDVPCPIFIRSIGMEGGIGPVGSSSHHGIFYRMPGIKIASPMTPEEYKSVYSEFMSGTDTVYVSEHRLSYSVEDETPSITQDNPDFVLFPFSVTRFEALKVPAATPLKVSVYPQTWINPLRIKESEIENLKASKYGGVVLDNDYPNGIAKQIAYELMHRSGKPVSVLCIDEKTAGFQPHNDNLPPSCEKIVTFLNSLN